MAKKIFVAVGIWLYAAAAFGQQPLTLQQAVAIALKNSYDVEIARNNLAINTINNDIGIAGGLPLVTGAFGENAQISSINQKFNNPLQDAQRNGAFSNNISGNITGSILLFNGFRVTATKQRLQALQQQSKYQLNAQLLNTAATVMFNYYNIVQLQAFSSTIQLAIDAAQAKLDIIKTRRSVGLANLADESQAQADLNTLLVSQQAQQLSINQSKTDLLTLLALKADSSITIKDTIIVNTHLRLDSIQQYLATYPDLLAANEQIRINQQIEKETATQRVPTIRATTGFNFTNINNNAGNSLLNQNYGPFIGFNVAIPIYNGGIFKRQQQIAAINTKNAEVQKQSVYANLNAGVVKNYQAYQNALQQLATQQENFRLSQQLLNLVLQRFQLGQATVIDLTLAQQAFSSAAYNLVNVTYQAKVGEIGLLQIAGQLGF